jgi:uncharacterized membrane protein
LAMSEGMHGVIWQAHVQRHSACSSLNGYFARYLRCSEILILKILNVFLRLKFYSALISNELSYLWMDAIAVYKDFLRHY